MTDSDDARKQATTAMFDRVAPDYDDGGVGSFSYFGRKLVDAVGIRAGQRVLDVAAGRGAAAIPAADITASTGTVVGVDLSAAMVATARSDAERAGVTVDFRVGDAESLEFADGSFDVLLCAFGLMFLPRVELALSEFRRVLTPGGTVGVSTWKTTQVADLGIVMAGCGFMDVDREVLRFADTSVLSAHLTDAGFESIEVREEIVATAYRGVEEYWTAARGTGMRRWIDRLDESQLAKVRTQLGERLADRIDDGVLNIDATALIAVARR
ncbi:MAG: class I SAM-dependent methyltransferase [Rhodococcus sp. (in: high G+C Gram-positive bacteria)]